MVSHSLSNSLIWPVYCRQLNDNAAPLTTAVLNFLELVTQTQIAATIDVKDISFIIPSRKHDKARLALIWKREQYLTDALRGVSIYPPQHRSNFYKYSHSLRT